MSNLIDDLRTVAAKVESTPGTEEAGSWTSSDAPFKTYDVSFNPNQEFEDRNPYSQTIGRESGIPTLLSATLSLETELVGSGDHTATVPPFDLLARGCGLQRFDDLETIALTSVTGDFLAGETVGDGSETAVVAQTFTAAGGSIYVHSRSGAMSGTLTGVTSGATATIGAVTDVGIVYQPRSSSLESLTLRHYNGADGSGGVLDTIAAARGNMTLRAETNQTVRLGCTFVGKPVTLGSSSAQLASSAPSRIPPAFKTVGLAIDMGTTGTAYAPEFDSLELDLGNQTAMPRDANDSTGRGYGLTRIPERQCSGSINARFTTPDDHPWYTKMTAGDTGPLSFTVGTVAGNKFIIHLPTVQYRNLSRDRDDSGLVNVSVDLGFYEGAVGNDEIFILCV